LEKEKKERSREVTTLVRAQMLSLNKKVIGQKFKALVSDYAPKKFFVARTNSYRPVVVSSKLGEFIDLEVTEAFSFFFKGKIL